MFIMLLDLDFVRLEIGAVSVLTFLASKPDSKSTDPSLGLFVIEPGGTSLDTCGPLAPLEGAGRLDISCLALCPDFSARLATTGLSVALSSSPTPLLVKMGVNMSRNLLSGDLMRSENVSFSSRLS